MENREICSEAGADAPERLFQEFGVSSESNNRPTVLPTPSAQSSVRWSPEYAAPSFLATHRLTRFSLSKSLVDLRQKVEALHGILDGRVLGKVANRVHDPALRLGLSRLTIRFQGVWRAILPRPARGATSAR
jgi:hypothetical protein